MKQDILREINACIRHNTNKLNEYYSRIKCCEDCELAGILRLWFQTRVRLDELKEEKKMILMCTKNDN